jgi:uncharacterized protein (DUF58 family)
MPSLADRISSRRLKGPEAEPVTLGPRRIYIVPTRHGMMFGVLLVVMLFGSINYNNSMGYALTFLLGGLASVSMLHTQRNLLRLRLRSGRVEPVFAGQAARFPVLLDAEGNRDRAAIGIEHNGRVAGVADVRPGATACLHVKARTAQRGHLPLDRFKVFTEYPLGLFHAWAWVELSASCLVYPRPDEDAPPFDTGAAGEGEAATGSRPGTDDFTGLRTYRLGDSPRRVAWKRASSGGDLLTKQFADGTSRTVWLDWDTLPTLLMEERLSRLCRWVLDCHGAGHRFGLRLPGNIIAPATGAAHLRQCLEALALFDFPARRPASPAPRTAAS